MTKRLFDVFLSAIGLIIIAPIIVPVMFLIWRQDGHSPFYIAPRVGRGGGDFRMVKLRSMVINADKSGVDSTSSDDQRITRVGSFIRKYKLDELSQLWNVFLGDMSLVGPRPNVRADTKLYTRVEQQLLSVRPGITDFSSIVFSDEGDILAGREDPDLVYNQLIRPYKSRLSLLYVEHSSLLLDVKLIFLTVVAIVSKETALRYVVELLEGLSADSETIKVAGRTSPLIPTPPPGSEKVVESR